MGSIIEVKKAPVERQANVTDTLDSLMALKKVNQWSAMINPASKNLRMSFLEMLLFIFFNLMYKKIKKTANNILNQTSGKASKEISAPKMAVKPQIKTMR